MNTIRLFLLSLVLSLTVLSCDSDVTRIDSLIFNESLTNAYLDGEPFAGKAWSGKEKTICIECDNGRIVKVTAYHTNGNVAIENNSLISEGTNYDNEGNPISLERLSSNYPEVVGAVKDMISRILVSPDLK